jgi:hypothetical protein
MLLCIEDVTEAAVATHQQALAAMFPGVRFRAYHSAAAVLPVGSATDAAANLLVEKIMVVARGKKAGRASFRAMLAYGNAETTSAGQEAMDARVDLSPWSRALKPILGYRPLDKLVKRDRVFENGAYRRIRYQATQLGRALHAAMVAKGLG